MPLFLTLMLIFTLSLVGVSVFTIWWMQKIATTAISGRFQAAEFILDRHTAPPDWVRPKTPLVRLWHLVSVRSRHGEDRDSLVKARLVRQLDELIMFFEKSPFFDDPATRAELLTQLQAERKSWQGKPLSEITGD